MNPGIYDGLSNKDYHADNAISRSDIMNLMDCPYIFWYKKLSGLYKQEENANLKLGNAVHTLLLEPDEFNERFIIKPECDRRTNEGKAVWQEFVDSTQGKTILTQDQLYTATILRDSVMRNKFAKTLLTANPSYIEQSLFWQPDIDVAQPENYQCKARPDFRCNDLIVDIKTAASIQPGAMSKAVYEYGYHIQAAMAIDAIKALTGETYSDFVIIAVEKNPPYMVANYALDPQAIELGRRAYKAGMLTYDYCVTHDHWPGYADELEDLSVPTYILNRERSIYD